MKVGTKSLLFGLHQFFTHPTFVLAGWIKLYGFNSLVYEWWKLLICILIHDWGYWGSPNIDGEEGEKHTEWAATKVEKWDKLDYINNIYVPFHHSYYYLCRYHSRFLAKKFGNKPSALCWADKLGTTMMPAWLWVNLGRLSGELPEIMNVPKHREALGNESDPYKYFALYKEYVKEVIRKECQVEL